MGFDGAPTVFGSANHRAEWFMMIVQHWSNNARCILPWLQCKFYVLNFGLNSKPKKENEYCSQKMSRCLDIRHLQTESLEEMDLGGGRRLQAMPNIGFTINIVICGSNQVKKKPTKSCRSHNNCYFLCHWIVDEHFWRIYFRAFGPVLGRGKWSAVSPENVKR